MRKLLLALILLNPGTSNSAGGLVCRGDAVAQLAGTTPSLAGLNTSGNIIATLASVQIQAVGSASSIGAYGAGTTYLDAMNAAGNDGLRIDNGGAITRYSSGAKGVVTLPSGGGVTISGGAFRFEAKTTAQLLTTTPAVGDVYRCSDCTVTLVVIATGTSAGNFAGFENAGFK